MTKLFISYAHANGQIVTIISDQLREAGYDVWIDTGGIQGGTLWSSEIAKAILDCDVFLLFISPQSVISDFVRREVDLAFDEKRKILPVMLEKVEIPVHLGYQLAGIQYIDYQAPEWKTRLLNALGSQPVQKAVKETGKLKNPYSSLPFLEPIERTLILSNREKELKKAVNYLGQHRLLLITGMPGIGKSTFARALLEFMPADSPTPFWYNFERQRSSGNSLSVLLDRISSYLDICLNMEVQREVMAFRNSESANASVNDVDILISFLNQDRPIWLVFDNLETVLSRDTNCFLDESIDLLFESLKNNMHNAKIIITNPFVPILKGGEPFLEAGTWPMTLGGLDNASAFEFLQAYGLNNLSETNLELLVREINGHPFVLNHIAHYIQAVGVSAGLESLQGGLEEISERFGDSLKVRLSPLEFHALQSLTILNREIRLNGLCYVAQVRPSIIMRLREKGLLQTSDSGHFWLHNIIRNSIKPADLNLIKQAHLRAMEFYQRQNLPQSHQSIDDYANVLEWHHHAVEAGQVNNAYSALYATGLKDQLMEWNEYDLLVRLCERSLSAVDQADADLSQKEATLSNNERINIYHTLGIALFLLGDFIRSIAHLTVALNLLDIQDHKESRIKLLIDLSESYNSSREYILAMEMCQNALVLLSSPYEKELYARAINLKGIIHRDMGNLDQAIQDLEEALKLFSILNDRVHSANVMGDLGIVYYSQNQFAEALTTHRQAIALYRASGDFRGMMIGHFNVGDILLLDQKYKLALKEFQTAMELARKKKIVWMEVDAGLYLIESQIALSQLDKAEQELSSLQPVIARQASFRQVGLGLFLQAYLFWMRNQLDSAMEYFHKSFELLENEGCEFDRARVYIKYADFSKGQRRLNEAKDTLEKSRKIFAQLNNQLGLEAIERMLAGF